ncbi:quinone oxidoreductase family protein [Pseudomonas sp. GL-B-26]|uniref:quinone oxidoreductase family protein n=1 Tax=Pseudomonas sp. GL-B-26 TaxID=2832394 RepID=UPI001CBDBBE4|nr:quinone oxidoreductase [Pseudomonas sp. GL-B-26]
MPTAIIANKAGGPEVLELHTFEQKKPGQGEVWIEHEAIGVNYLDINHRDGSVPLSFPSGIGIEGSGRVVDIGPGVEGFSVGSRVAYALGEIGSYSSGRLISGDRLLPLPEWISYDDAAAVTLKGLTAHYLLFSAYTVTANTTVLMYGVAGALGQMMASWAKSLGATVIGVVSDEASIEIGLQAGCDSVLPWDQNNLPNQVADLTNGKLVDVVYDGIGKISFDTSLACLRTRGTMVSIGAISGIPAPIDIGKINKKSLYLTRPSLVAYTSDPNEYKARGEAVFDAVKQGILKPTVWKSYSLEQVREAHEALQSGQSRGTILLKP